MQKLIIALLVFSSVAVARPVDGQEDRISSMPRMSTGQEARVLVKDFYSKFKWSTAGWLANIGLMAALNPRTSAGSNKKYSQREVVQGLLGKYISLAYWLGTSRNTNFIKRISNEDLSLNASPLDQECKNLLRDVNAFIPKSFGLNIVTDTAFIAGQQYYQLYNNKWSLLGGIAILPALLVDSYAMIELAWRARSLVQKIEADERR